MVQRLFHFYLSKQLVYIFIVLAYVRLSPIWSMIDSPHIVQLARLQKYIIEIICKHLIALLVVSRTSMSYKHKCSFCSYSLYFSFLSLGHNFTCIVFMMSAIHRRIIPSIVVPMLSFSGSHSLLETLLASKVRESMS